MQAGQLVLRAPLDLLVLLEQDQLDQLVHWADQQDQPVSQVQAEVLPDQQARLVPLDQQVQQVTRVQLDWVSPDQLASLAQQALDQQVRQVSQVQQAPVQQATLVRLVPRVQLVWQDSRVQQDQRVTLVQLV